MVTIGLDYTSEAGWRISLCVLDMGDVLSGGSKGVRIASICIRTGFRSLRAEIDDERSHGRLPPTRQRVDPPASQLLRIKRTPSVASSRREKLHHAYSKATNTQYPHESFQNKPRTP